ncbi:hypothetical protein HHI36_015312 [Cryptolaemus montrouzieri]|uniref:Cytochrome P450 n=1 Tax=Cryptolaemus montrouzieri TaxID=559131 RepID=A0ABD2N5G1_9CUCU
MEELFSKNVFTLKGQTWKNMRSILSPSFTSSKIRIMFTAISRNAKLFAQNFLKGKEEIIEVEFKDAFTRITNDVIANITLGIEVDSFHDKENEFYMMGKEVHNFSSLWKRCKMLLIVCLPKIAALFRLSVFGEEMRFFENLVKHSIKIREENDIRKVDMLGLLIEARRNYLDQQSKNSKQNSVAEVNENVNIKNTEEDLSDTAIASQVFSFFLASYEFTAKSMCFLIHELAINPDIQNKLYQEFCENTTTTEDLDYETVLKMTYFDMVVTETLRKWPVAAATERVVTKPYTIQPETPEEHAVHLEAGLDVRIPILSFHRDPKYFKNPEKFDPERFSAENKKNIVPYTYLPFGVGPRNCIANRFVLLEMKAILYYLLMSFEVTTIEKTDIPLDLTKSNFQCMLENDFLLGLKRRI